MDAPVSFTEAKNIQQELRRHLKIYDDFGHIKYVGGIDVGYDTSRRMAQASIVIMEWKSLKLVESVQAFVSVDFPYVPGFLSFREIPAILEAMKKLAIQPGLLMVDGQGIAHPRRMGIAAHLGVLLDRPAIGVAKSCLCGRYGMPAEQKGSATPLLDGDEQIGVVLRSRDHVRPLFISPGHRVGMKSAEQLVMHCLTRYRLPEPTRIADKLSKKKA